MWPIWRLWNDKGIDLHKLKWEWTWVEVMEANAILDQQVDQKAAVDAYIDSTK